ncbi:MAG: glycosyltransferase [Hyphomicrobiaceae bacterium]
MVTQLPDISVVMSVYNGAEGLAETVDSILTQQGVTLEFIIIDDGSTDGSGDILDAYATRDPRVRVHHQANQGLTRALATGCAMARGRYIARQDAGDVSLADRLVRLINLLDGDRDVVMVTCGTAFVGPEGEQLYTVQQNSLELQNGLNELDFAKVRGPSHHGSTMFRRDMYNAAGGYRPAFRVAQDIDLWTRLVERGPCLAIPDVLYQAKWAPGSISATKRPEQIRTLKTILECAAARRGGGEEAKVLRRWSQEQDRAPARDRVWRSRSSEDARFYYFIGNILRKTEAARSRHYYVEAIRCRPLYARAWAGLVRQMISR